MKQAIIFLITFLFVSHTSAKIWQVGVTRNYTAPSQVATLVGNGDTVEIDAATYNSDVARWTANNLLLKRVGGMAHLKANGLASGGKAIWVIAGNNTRIEFVEFSLCSVPSFNGAGIRQEGSNLTVSHCYFHHNENGILAGTVSASKIVIEFSEFAYNGYGDGLSHNLYINNIDTLIFRYNYSHHAKIGHELKSRAHVNHILYNRISNESAGTASRNIDLPNGGNAFIIGNIIEKGPLAQNSNLVGFGLEGLSNPAPHSIYAINNTMVNNRSAGSFFSIQSGTALFKGYNNIIAGNGSFIIGSMPPNLDTASNRVVANIAVFNFANASGYDYHIGASSNLLLNGGTNPGSYNAFSLSPNKEYAHSNNIVSRCVNGSLDIGAYELCAGNYINAIVKNYISIYPNPATDVLTVNVLEAGDYSTEIYTMTGLCVYSSKNSSALNISNLGTGIYMLVVKQEEELWKYKFVKK